MQNALSQVLAAGSVNPQPLITTLGMVIGLLELQKIMAATCLIFGIIFAFISLFREERFQGLRIAALLFLLSVAFITKNIWFYLFSIVVIATVVIPGDFLKSLTEEPAKKSKAGNKKEAKMLERFRKLPIPYLCLVISGKVVAAVGIGILLAPYLQGLGWWMILLGIAITVPGAYQVLLK